MLFFFYFIFFFLDCVGKYNAAMTTTDKLIHFNDPKATLQYPIIVMYDLETTAGFGLMIPVSYLIYVSVNSRYLSEGDNSQNYCSTRTIWRNKDQTSELHLPMVIKTNVSSSDKKTFLKYANIVANENLDEIIEDTTITRSKDRKIKRNYHIIDFFFLKLILSYQAHFKNSSYEQ